MSDSKKYLHNDWIIYPPKDAYEWYSKEINKPVDEFSEEDKKAGFKRFFFKIAEDLSMLEECDT